MFVVSLTFKKKVMYQIQKYKEKTDRIFLYKIEKKNVPEWFFLQIKFWINKKNCQIF